MKKIYLIFILYFGFCFGLSAVNDSISIDGKKYAIVMMDYPHAIGSGTTYYSYRLPEYPLEVFIMEIDANNPYVKFEACLSKDSTLNLETVQSMASRKSYSGHRVLGGINGDFFTMTGTTAGTTCNGSMCDGQIGVTPTDFGPMLGFDIDNVPFIDDMQFIGKVKYNDVEHKIDNVNTGRGEDKLNLYTYLNGKTTKTNQYGTEVVLTLKEGQTYKANDNLIFLVKKVNKGIGSTAIGEDEVVLSGHQTKADFLNDFMIGDEVTLHLGIILLSYPDLLPQFTEMLGSNCVFLKDGQNVPVTTDSGAPNGDNPRTAAGFSQDKSTVYFCVVDGRSGLSKGLYTRQLADIMRHAGAATAMNFDGGGSSVLLVRGQPGNKPAQMPLRSVANAFFAVSTAPDDRIVDQIEINCRELNISFGNKIQLTVSTLNQYGNPIDYKNASGVEFRVIGGIGEITNTGIFSASGNASSGYIEAVYNGSFVDKIPVNVSPVKELQFSLSHFVMDHLHHYKLIIEGRDRENKSYVLDNSLLQFKSQDEAIVTVNREGIVHGLAEGITEIEVSTPDGLVKDNCTVKVEIGRDIVVLDNFENDWEISMTDFIDNTTLTRRIPEGYSHEMLAVDYVMTYENRTAFIEIEKELPIYGIPEALELEMISNGKLASLTLSLDRTNNGSCFFEKFKSNSLSFYNYDLDFANFQQEDYPLKFKKIRLTVEKDNNEYVKFEEYKGTYYLKNIKIIYPDKGSGISSDSHSFDTLVHLYPNPSKGILYIDNKGESITGINVYGLEGVCLISLKEITKEIDLSHLPEGIYICETMIAGNHNQINKIKITK